MNPQEYQAFSDALQRTLERDSRVRGLIAAGSMACLSHQPDEWSDHDFWVIVEPNALEWFLTHHEWLPDSEQIVLWFRETQDGFKVVYRNGHLIEYAVFDGQGLLRAKVNDYRMLIDRAGLAANVARLQEETSSGDSWASDDLSLLGQFITNLLVGVGRYRRGEHLEAVMNLAQCFPLTPESPLPRERGEGTCLRPHKCSPSPAAREKRPGG